MKPLVYYPPDCRNASVNVFAEGYQCTDVYGAYSSIFSLVEKTVLDIIHTPCVTKYNSPACPELEKWQKTMESRGIFPTMRLKDVYARNAASLPRQKIHNTNTGAAHSAPPLPRKQ